MNLLTHISTLYKKVGGALDYLIETKSDVDYSEAWTRINQEGLYWDQIDRRALWGNVSREVSEIHESLEEVVSRFKQEGTLNKQALNLGCGNSDSTLYLLEEGWTVIAVDYSEEVLKNLTKIAKGLFGEGVKNRQLITVCKDIENYAFPKNMTLIVASKILPYVNPKQIQALWNKIYHSLAEGGRIVGHFFSRPISVCSEIFHRAILGAWFTDKATVRSLLEQGYKVEACRHSHFLWSQKRKIEFIAKKQEGGKFEKGLVAMHLSSYVDAVRGLPSKNSQLLFCMDRLVELKEVSKLVVLVSGTVALAQVLGGSNPMEALSVFAASIGVWFLFKQLVEKTSPLAQAHIRKVREIDYQSSQEFKKILEKIKSKQAQQLLRLNSF